MDLSTGLLLAVVLLMVLNRALYMPKGWAQARLRFWALQVVNLLTSCALILWGIPGFEGPLSILNLMLGGLLVLHIIQNNRRLQRALENQDEEEDAELEARRQAMLEKLKGPTEEG